MSYSKSTWLSQPAQGRSCSCKIAISPCQASRAVVCKSPWNDFARHPRSSLGDFSRNSRNAARNMHRLVGLNMEKGGRRKEEGGRRKLGQVSRAKPIAGKTRRLRQARPNWRASAVGRWKSAAGTTQIYYLLPASHCFRGGGPGAAALRPLVVFYTLRPAKMPAALECAMCNACGQKDPVGGMQLLALGGLRPLR